MRVVATTPSTVNAVATAVNIIFIFITSSRRILEISEKGSQCDLESTM